MNNILFAESMEIEFRHIFTECENSVAYANARLMDDGLIPSYIMEAGEEGKSGGLFGFIKRMFGAIIKLLSEAGKKFKSILFGSELDPSKANEKIKVDKNPEGLVKLLNGEMPKYKDFLAKCMRGEVSVEEAKAFCEEKKGAFGAIGTVVISSGALFGIAKTTDKYISKWKDDVEETFDTCSDEIRKLTEKGARTKGGMDPKTIEEATQLILNNMSQTTNSVIGSIEKSVRELYVKNYVKERMTKNVNTMTTTKGRLKAKADATKRTIDSVVYTAKNSMLDANIKKGVEADKKIAEQDRKNKERMAKSDAETYNNTGSKPQSKMMKAASWVNPDGEQESREEKEERAKKNKKPLSKLQQIARWENPANKE